MGYPIVPILLATAIFNTLIALFLTVVWTATGGHRFGELFGLNLIWSQCIGLSVCLATLSVLKAPLAGWRKILAISVAITLGAAAGGTLAPMLAGGSDEPMASSWVPLFIGIFFGTIASVFFWLRERNAELTRQVEARERARVEAEKRSIEAQLKMLQAQIEPHFLFNSLANVSSLIGSEPTLASALLDALIRYLRASLTRTRADSGTVGDEVELLRAYLEVLRIRMGERLRYDFDIAPDLLAHPLPPMLLQPLVENAVRHGLEPKIEGGTVRVSARRQENSLLLTVADDGLGFSDTAAGGSGMGLSNVRARLEALFGAAGRLELSAKHGAGVTAQVYVPLERLT